MKRVNVIIALVFVSMFIFPACEDKLDEIEVEEPTSKKMKDLENLNDGDFW